MRIALEKYTPQNFIEKIEIKKISINFIPTTLQFREVKVRFASDFPIQQTRLRKIEIGMSFWKMLMAKTSFLNLVLSDANINILEKDFYKKNDSNKLVDNKQPLKSLSGVLPFYSLRFEKLSLSMYSEDGGVIKSKHIDALIEKKHRDDLSLMISAKNLIASMDEHIFCNDCNLELKGLFTGREFNSTFLSLNDLNYNSTGTIKAQGFFSEKNIRSLEGVNITADLNADIDSLAISEAFGLESGFGSMKGNLEFNSYLSIDDSKPTDWALDGDLKLKNAQILGFNLFNSNLKLRLDSERLEIEELMLIKEKKEIGNIKGQLKFSPQTPLNLNVKLKGTSLDELTNLLNIDNTDINFDIYSNRFKVTGTTNPINLNMYGDVELSKMHFVPKATKLEEQLTCKTKLHLRTNKRELSLKAHGGLCKLKDRNYIPNLEEREIYDTTEWSKINLNGLIPYDHRMSSFNLDLFLSIILFEKPIVVIENETLFAFVVSPPDNFKLYFFWSCLNDFEIIFKFFFENLLLFPEPEIK